MNKLLISCAILFLSTQPKQLWAQTTGRNLLMGVGNDNTHGEFNTSYGFLQRLEGDPPAFAPPYTGGTANTFIGSNSGNYNAGSNNTALGYGSGGFFLQGNNNVFIGSGASATPGSVISRSSVVSGNSFLGFQAGYKNQADYNVFIGYQSGYSNTIGIRNVFVGVSAGYANTGGDNAFMGHQAGQANTTGTDNTFLGSLSGQNTTTGQFNSFVGSYTGQANSTGRLNAFLGYASGSMNTSGGVNTFIGAFAGNANTTGNRNSFLGTSAGQLTTSGSNNVFGGYQSGNANTTGYSNVVLGIQSAYRNQTGHNNVVVGDSAGYNATVSANTFVGSKAGYSNQAGSQNTFLGFKADVKSANLTNAAAIGANALVSVSNAIVLGDSAAGTKVGIGVTGPQFPLDVKGIINIRGNGTIKFAHLSNPLHEGTTDQFLTVNEVGETVLAKYRLRINNATEWSDKVFETGYKLKSLAEVGQYIQTNKHLPGIPSAVEVVEQGIDVAKMNTKLLEKIEELTLYSIQQQKEIDELKRLVKQLVGKK